MIRPRHHLDAGPIPLRVGSGRKPVELVGGRHDRPCELAGRGRGLDRIVGVQLVHHDLGIDSAVRVLDARAVNLDADVVDESARAPRNSGADCW
jgi:hypothetical protein